MATTSTSAGAPDTPDKLSRSTSPASPQFKLRPAESGDAEPGSATDDPANASATAQDPDGSVDAQTQESLMYMLNAVQQLHQQSQQNQASAAGLAHGESAEDGENDGPAQAGGTPPPGAMQDLQLDPALMGSGAPNQPPHVPPQQQQVPPQQLPGQPPHPMHPHHMHHQPAMMYHHPPQYIASPYPPPAGHPMPPPPELQQIAQPAVRATRSGRAGTIPSGDSQYEDDGEEGDPSFADANGQVSSGQSAETPAQGGASGNKKGKWATSDTVDWQRKRKDNHKEVERRRRSNINEGINELARMVPNVGAEKAKGAILARSVQYIHDLKENEARNIEKWTLEKLLMDQAMGDLQAQLDEMRQRLEEERQRREQVEAQLAETLRLQQERAVHEEPGAKRPRVE
ncbi:centromere-binding protein 1 [Ceratobasidium sp. AG-Ba]|nr:centromere-binding protein 1 [Ceratobasidium sp. AG-Ba]